MRISNNKSSFSLVSGLCSLLLLACDPEPTPEPFIDPTPTCVTDEPITASDTGFHVFVGGPDAVAGQNLKGIKINEEWLARGYLVIRDTTFRIGALTFWGDEPDGVLRAAEAFIIRKIPLFADFSPGQCFVLANESDGELALETEYYNLHGDLRLRNHSYYVDETQDNYLEVTEFDEEQGIFKGKLQVSLIDDTPSPPEYPGHIRFFNVAIDIRAL